MNTATKTSPRGAHDTKITTYLTTRELLAIDHTILEMRRVYGIKIDRSRFVREAVAAASARLVAERVRGASA